MLAHTITQTYHALRLCLSFSLCLSICHCHIASLQKLIQINRICYANVEFDLCSFQCIVATMLPSIDTFSMVLRFLGGTRYLLLVSSVDNFVLRVFVYLCARASVIQWYKWNRKLIKFSFCALLKLPHTPNAARCVVHAADSYNNKAFTSICVLFCAHNSTRKFRCFGYCHFQTLFNKHRNGMMEFKRTAIHGAFSGTSWRENLVSCSNKWRTRHSRCEKWTHTRHIWCCYRSRRRYLSCNISMYVRMRVCLIRL